MRKIVIAGIVAAMAAMMMLVAGAPVVNAGNGETFDPQGPPFDGEPPGVDFFSDNVMNQSQMNQRIQELCQIALQHRMFGPFDYDDGMVMGYFVHLLYDEESGVITDYAVRTGEVFVDLFLSINVDDFVPEGMKTTGSVFMQWNDTHRMIVHNNPTAMLHVGSDHPTFISFLLGEGTEVNETEGGLDAVVEIIGDGVDAIIGVGNGSIAIENSSEGVYVNATANEGQVFFRMKPFFAGTGAQFENEVMSAIANGKVSNEMALMARNGDTIAVETSYDHRYGMKMQGVEGNKIMVQVSSEMSEGKVMILKFDANSLDASYGVKVLLDGHELTGGDLGSVLAASGSEMSDARHCLIEDGENYALVVYVPYFSTHLLEIEGTAALSDIPLSLIGIGALAVAVIAIAIVAVSRRR